MTPLLSVLMISYNHERYIKQSVESVLMQKVSFPMEIVIADDASTDATPLLLKELAKRDHRIRLLARRKNLGPVPNFYATLNECRGRYVALLEGDDYWTDDGKLQAQADLLQENPDTTFCFHACTVLNEAKQIAEDETLLNATSFADPVSFAKVRGYCHTASVVFRRSSLPSIPAEFHSLYAADSACFFMLSARGRVRYLPHTWCVYRIHAGGIWSGLKHGTHHNFHANTIIARVLRRESHPDARSWAKQLFYQLKPQLHIDICQLVELGLWREGRWFVWVYLFGFPSPQFVPPPGFWALYLRLMLGVPSRYMLSRSAQPRACGG